MTDMMEHVPHPGSRMDATARAAAAESPGDPYITELPESAPIVSVRDESPALGGAHCVVLSAANPVLRLLGQDPARRSAVILAVDNDIYIGTSKSELQQIAGTTTGGTGAGYLPAGIGIPWNNKGGLLAAATTTGTNSRVTVLISRDEQ